MAAEGQSADRSEQVISSRRKESKNERFISEDTLDREPCDVVLIVKDGREIKAHRRVLSEASPFFEKLLNSDMKETQEGVVRLEMYAESVMAATLQFIYTGHVQILAEDNARDLIVVADYLFLDKLKLLAGGVLLRKLNTTNCVSTYYFAERYQCEDLLSNTKKYFLANFTSIYATCRENILNMSSREIEMWISSDEIEVSAEEDVFKIILEWIDHDRSRRKKYFVELFRHVRLVYVSSAVLHDIATNELVQDNNSCLMLVEDAIKDFYGYGRLCVPSRKALETSVVVFNLDKIILCYFPGENSLCKLGEIPAVLITCSNFVPSYGHLYRTVQEFSYYQLPSLKQVTYNPYSNRCMQLPALEEGRYLRRTFDRNGDEMYALMSEPCVREHLRGPQGFLVNSPRTETDNNCRSRKHTSFLTYKYRAELHSWENVTSFDYLDLREGFYIVANDNFIYFIGGSVWSGNEHYTFLSDVDRYNLSRNQWDKVPDIQVAKCWVTGAAVNEKVYIVGEVAPPSFVSSACRQWEVYDETTNEWQFITGIGDAPGYDVDIMNVDGDLCALGIKRCFRDYIRIDRYDPEEKKWETRHEVTAGSATVFGSPPAMVCSMRVDKMLFRNRFLEAFPHASDESLPADTTTQPRFTAKKRERKCLIM